MTNQIKTYGQASDARRAAKKAGVTEPVITKTEEGRYTWAAPAPVAPAEKTPRGPKGIKMDNARNLMREKGATAAEIAALNDWSMHTVTNFLCTLRTVENLKVEKARNEDGVYVYKIAA